jgi:hypothetical protein
MVRYIYEKDDDVNDLIVFLDFDPLEFLNKKDEVHTVGELFNLSLPCEDDLNDRTIRFCDEDACFEVKFHYIEGGAAVVGSVDPKYHDLVDFYVEDGKYYSIETACEL